VVKLQQTAVRLLAYQGWLTSAQAATINRLIGHL